MQDGADKRFVGRRARREVVEESDPGAYFGFGTERSLRAAVVSGGVEKGGEGEGEGGGSCAGEAGADDAEFGAGDGGGRLLAHCVGVVMRWCVVSVDEFIGYLCMCAVLYGRRSSNVRRSGAE